MEQEKRKFVLKNVPECQPDYLQDYIEYHLDNDVIQMKRLEVFPDIVLITMKDDINFVEAVGKVKSEPLEDQRLIILPTWQVFSIVVCNIDYNVLSAEFLQLYIENTFADGEAVVAVCTTWPRNGVAIIQFEKTSPSDLVQRILAVDQHVPFPRDLGEYCITMEPFYHNFHDCLKQDVALPVQDGSCFKSDIGLSAQSGSKFADAKIAESKTNAFVESEMASSLVMEQNGDLGGNKQEEHQKKEHIDNNIPRGRGVTCRESRASHSVYKVENKLPGTHDNHTRQTTESRGGGRGREHDTRSYNFGDKEASVRTKCTFQEGLSRVDPTEAVSKISNNKVEEIDVSLIQAEVMIEQFGKSNDLYVQYERGTSKVIIHGVEEKVREKHMSILCELRKIKEDSLELSPIMSKILSQGKGDQFLNASLQDVHWLITGRTLQVAGYEKVSIDKAIQFLKESLNYKQVLEMKIESTYYKLWQLKDELESKLHLVVLWDDKKEHITIEGLKKDVVTAKCRIKEFLEEYEEVCEKFEVHGINARFFHSFLISEVEQSLKGVTLLKHEWTDTLVTYVIRGKRDVLKQTMKTLKDLETQIILQKWSLKSEFKKAEEIGLIVYRIMHTPLKEEFRELEMQNRCLVIFSDGVHGMAPAQNKSVNPDSIPTKGRSFRPAAKSKARAISPVETKDVVLSITPSCQMRIKTRGNIAQERSDILVCVLINEEQIRMKKTRIGLAFSQANHSLEKHLQAERKAMQDMTVTITGPFQNFNCQAIAAIFLSKWDPTSSVSLLTKAIEHILSEAVARGAKSISFPALGSGRALKFPPAEVAEISMSTIKSFFSAPTAGNLQDIVFVLPDRDLFTCFKTVSTNHFTAVSPPRINVAGSEDPNEEFDKDDDDDDDDDYDDDDGADESVNFILSNGNENMNVSILALKDADMLGMWNKVTAKLKLLCLAKDFFNQEEIDHWPKQARYEIVEEAKKLHVWVEMSKNPKTGKPGYAITGEKCAVRDMRIVIDNVFIKLLQRMPKSLKSSKAPKRHTTHFLTYAAGLDNDKHFPSYWKLNKSKTFFQKICASLSQGEGNVLVDVEKKTSMAVENLVMKTWKANLVGQGRDASGLSHKGIKVISVQRVENPQLFEKFNFKRKHLFRKASNCGRVCTPVKEVSRVREGVNTTQNLEDFMKEELYGEINEHYLFHGCPSSFLQAILTQGLDPKVSSVKALFGKAIYFAESSSKSDQYADEKGNRTANGTQLVMILARVLLGNVFICDQNHPTVAKKDAEKLKRPPCMNCKQDVCNCHGTHFDSVLGEGKWLFREFMVYGENECYPEYVINYVRV